MYSRRSFVGTAAAFTSAAAANALFSPDSARAQDACAVFTPDRQKAVTPKEALQRLIDGNERFIAGKTVNCNLLAQVKDTSNAQAPFAVVVGCIDSRVPPELVFDQRIGDIFAARIAGNFVNVDILGSLEFACKVAGAKAIVVLGHTECGAIKGAIDQAKLGNLTAMLKNFDPAIAMTKITGERSSKDKALVQTVADNHSRITAKQILDASPVLKEMFDKGEITIAAAMHDLGSGKVSILPNLT